MYQGKYPDGVLPPGYNGVAYTQTEYGPAEFEDENEEEDRECHASEREPVCNTELTETPHRKNILDKLFSHKLDLEDLLLLALIVMTISSGADGELVTMLALLFVFGL